MTWPPTKARVERLERIEKAYAELQEKQLLQPFVDEFASKLATLAAATPYKQWSDEFKSVFKVLKRSHPDIAELYLSRLPKE